MLRSIKPENYISIKDSVVKLIDIRRSDDFKASDDIVSGAEWKDPAKIDDWISTVPNEGQVIIYCVKGGGVSNSVVDRLQADGINAQFIEGGLEGLKSAGGPIERK